MPRFTKKKMLLLGVGWKNGWEGPKQKIVCLHVRDNEYMNTILKKIIGIIIHVEMQILMILMM